MSTVDVWLANHCSNLSPDQYQIISPKTSDYNCIPWAAEEDDRWWDPTDPYGYWLDEVPRELTLVERSGALKRGALLPKSRKLANISSVLRGSGVRYFLAAERVAGFRLSESRTSWAIYRRL